MLSSLITNIEEGSIYHGGLNYMKTSNGHGLWLQIHLPKSYRLRFGYYFGNKLAFRYEFYNHDENEKRINEFEKNVKREVIIGSAGDIYVKRPD